jgi:putative MATE family efflux protein
MSAPEPAPYREIVRLSAPTILVAFAQAAAQTAEVWLIGHLGTAALAGYALVLPLLLLLQMMSAGAMGGGVVSAVARALGAWRRDEASALVLHALLIGALMGLAFSLLALGPGEALFRLVGGRGEALEQAVAYATFLFAGSVPVWVTNSLAAVLRGAGNMRLPARIMLCCWAIEVPLSAFLMLGLGLGIAGAGIAYALVFVIAAAAMLTAILRGAAGFRPRLDAGLDRRLFGRILSVGLVASVTSTLANLTTVLVTALVARHGDAAIAAYGVGVRLEFLMVPLAFGIGATLTTLVGRRVGAGAWPAARRTAWRGGALAAALGAAIGGAAALAAPWIAAAFSQDETVRAAIRLYLLLVGPAFGAFGLGMALYFASQGAGRMAWPLGASVLRVVVATGGGWLLAEALGFGLAGQFTAVALALLAYGAAVALSVRPGVWR